jgi:hypothetical protein
MSKNSGRVVRHDNEGDPEKTVEARPFLVNNKIRLDARPEDMKNKEDHQNVPPDGMQKSANEKA